MVDNDNNKPQLSLTNSCNVILLDKGLERWKGLFKVIESCTIR